MSRRLRDGLGACLVALAVLATCPPAHAQGDVKREARERFDRGLRLFNQGDAAGALAEFEEAYRRVPHPMVLYNIALVHAARNHPVDAVDAYDRLLANPGKLDADRLARARQQRAEQAARIGEVDISVRVASAASVVSAAIEVDGVEVGKTPLAQPLKVSSGVHVIGVVAPGYIPVRRQVTVAGQSTARVQIELQPLEGQLAQLELIVSLPDAEVAVDGNAVGRSPLPATLALAPGDHVIEVKRPGYLPVKKVVKLGGGATGRVEVELLLDSSQLVPEGGQLALDISEPDAVIFVDGQARGAYAGEFRLPRGVHRLRIERANFITYERDVFVEQGRTVTLPIELEPTPEYRADYTATARRRRGWGWGTFSFGAATVVGAGAAIGASYSAESSQDNEIDRFLTEVNVQGSGTVCDSLSTNFDPDACEAQRQVLLDDLDAIVRRRKIAGGVAVVGAVSLAAGVVLLAISDDPDRYQPSDESDVFASVVPVGWVSGRSGGVGLTGSF